MLGESFEMVTDTYRFIAEKVQHTPEQINCYRMEGEGYTVESYDKSNLKLGFGGGRGQINMEPKGFYDVYYKKYNDHVTISKFKILVRQILIGPLYVDFDTQIKAISHDTGAKLYYNFIPKSGNKLSHVMGQGFDSDGRKTLEIQGSWLDEIRIIDCLTNEAEVVWKAPPLDPEAYLQFFFSTRACTMNYFTPEMNGVIAPTDSRYRKDVRCLEEGKLEEADDAKLMIETGQRKRRK